jgi:hypothetical protein
LPPPPCGPVAAGGYLKKKTAAFRLALSSVPTSLLITELVNIETITQSPFTLKFKESGRSKNIWYAVCWQIQRQRLESPTTAMIMAVVS